MEQRRLRLGDILDDYCPRERRVTNHAVVAMIDEDVKQTRCTTCDAEHPYKGGTAPRRRKKTSDAVPALAAPAVEAPPPLRATATAVASHAEEVAQPAHEDEQDDLPFLSEEAGPAAPLLSVDGDADLPEDEPHEDEPHDDEVMPESGPVEEGPVHRRLIRATLPRVEGQKDARQPTEFTIRQSNGHGGNNYRGDNRQQMRGGGGQPASGNRAHGSPRFAGSRPANGGRGGPRGQNSGFRSAQPQQQRRGGGGGRKRSR